jgi:hypothetical protein
VHSDTALISVGNHEPKVTIMAPAEDFRYSIGELISFVADVADTEDAPFPPQAISWRVFLHHGDHVHPDFAFGFYTYSRQYQSIRICSDRVQSALEAASNLPAYQILVYPSRSVAIRFKLPNMNDFISAGGIEPFAIRRKL